MLIGEIRMYAAATPPPGWLLCDGTVYTIGQYPNLFAAIGNVFGGDGETTFAVPDFRSSVPIGVGTRPGLSTYALGQTGGAEKQTLIPGNLPAHTHMVNADDRSSSTGRPAGTIPGFSGANVYSSNPGNTQMAEAMVAAFDGGSSPFEILPPFLAITFIIATVEG